MHIDLIIVILLLIMVVFYFRRWSNFVYAVAIIDIFLRILAFIRDNVPIPELKRFLAKYFSSSVPDILDNYTKGILFTILMWVLVIIYICFLFYVFRTFLKKKK
jgi:hypothetical protein